MKELKWAKVPIPMLCDNNVTKNMIRVYAALSTIQGKASSCSPKIETIQKRCGMDYSAVSRALTALEKAGWIKKERRYAKSSIYTCFEDLDENNQDDFIHNEIIDIDNNHQDKVDVKHQDKVDGNRQNNNIKTFSKDLLKDCLPQVSIMTSRDKYAPPEMLMESFSHLFRRAL